MKTLSLIIALLSLGWIDAQALAARERRVSKPAPAEQAKAAEDPGPLGEEGPAPRPGLQQEPTVVAATLPRESVAAPAAPVEPASAADDAVVRETRFVYLQPASPADKDRHERGMRLGGPRFGVTYVDGPVSKRTRDNLKNMRGSEGEGDLKPWLAQFGWHTEYRFFRTDGGTTALLEFIPLVGGMNQGLVLPSANLLFGLRTVSGLEFGAGPNANMDGASYIVAAGYSFDLGGLIIPLNAAVGFGQERSAYTLSTGFNL